MNLDKDELAEVYKKAVLQRSNSFKVYKSKLNQKAFEAMARGKLSTTDGLQYFYYDWAPAIFEYDSSGRLVSMLLRKMALTPHSMGKKDPSAPVKIMMHTFVFDQAQSYSVENGLNNNDLAAYELYSSAPKASQSSDSSAQTQSSKIEKIKELHELYKAGALSKEEYEAEKAKLLAGQPQQPVAQAAPVKAKNSFQMLFEMKAIEAFNRQNGTSFTSMDEIRRHQQKN